MKIKCCECAATFDGNINLVNRIDTPDKWQWTATCKNCGKTFPVTVSQGKIIMAFVDNDRDDYHDFFTDEFLGKEIISYYAFSDADSFLEKWREIAGNPDGMWYWVLIDGEVICSGACDPGDEEIFAEYFAV